MKRMNLWPSRRIKKYSYIIPGLIFLIAFIILNIRISGYSRIADKDFSEVSEALEFSEKKVNSLLIKMAEIPDIKSLEKEYSQIARKYEHINSALRYQAFSFSAFAGLLESFLPQNLKVLDMDFNQNVKSKITCILTGASKDVATITRFVEILEKHNDINNVFLHYHKEKTDSRGALMNEFDFRVAFDLGGSKNED
jgi:ABC-type sugar transport system permease subunit